MQEGRVQCPSCKHWQVQVAADASATVHMRDVLADEHKRIVCGFWDLVFGDPPGVVTTSSTLLGGMPGAGKSTFALQFAAAICKATGGSVLYLPSEETPNQIKPRAKRLGVETSDILFMRNVSTDADLWEAVVKSEKPKAMVVDSLSGLTRDVHLAVNIAGALKRKIAQPYECPVLIIDHITKQDDFAGLMKLQHEVDTLVGLLNKDDTEVRIMRPFKNRFGPTDKDHEILVTMGASGLMLHEKKKKVKKNGNADRKDKPDNDRIRS